MLSTIKIYFLLCQVPIVQDSLRNILDQSNFIALMSSLSYLLSSFSSLKILCKIPSSKQILFLACHSSHIYKGNSLLINQVLKALDNHILKYLRCSSKEKTIRDAMDPLSLKSSLVYQNCSVKVNVKSFKRLLRKVRPYMQTHIHKDHK